MNLRIKSVTFVFYLLSVLLFSFMVGCYFYEGSTTYYVGFSLILFVLLYFGITQKKNFSFLFLSVFLWLGFWLKLTLHTIFKYPYQEAIGSFVQTGASLDNLVLVASVGCLGVLFGRWLFLLTGLSSSRVIEITPPQWYQTYRHWVLPWMLLFIIFIALLNMTLGIFQIGLLNRTTLIWPLNALISWGLSIGFALMISTILWWEIQSSRGSFYSFLYVFIEGFFTSISVMSRAVFIFHVLPNGLAYSLNQQKDKLLSCKKLIFIGLLGAVFLVLSVYVANTLRDHYYTHVEPDVPSLPQFVEQPQVQSFSQATHKILALLVDRWIGIEGVMAVSSYEPKQIDLLVEGLLEKSAFGHLGLYQVISKSQYREIDLDHYMFATLPGAVAFMYYSGSLWIVFLGLSILTLLMMLSESIASALTNNPLICSVYGASIASTVAQLGVAPRMMLKHYCLVFIYFLMIYVIQSIRSIVPVFKKTEASLS